MSTLPPGATPLEPAEAIRRIQERDHVILPGQHRLGFEYEQALISMIKRGWIQAALLEDGQLAFTPTDQFPMEDEQ